MKRAFLISSFLLAACLLATLPGSAAIGVRPIDGDADDAFRRAVTRQLGRLGFEVEPLGATEALPGAPEKTSSARKALVFDLSLTETVTGLELGEKAADDLARQLAEQGGYGATRVYPSLRRNGARLQRAVKIDGTLHEGELSLPMSSERAQQIGKVLSADIAVYGEITSSSYDPKASQATVGLSLCLLQIGTGQTKRAKVEATSPVHSEMAKEALTEEAASAAAAEGVTELLRPGPISPGEKRPVLAVLEGKLAAQGGGQGPGAGGQRFTGQLTDRGGRPLWRGEVELPAAATSAGRQLVQNAGLRAALDRVRLADDLAAAKLVNVIVTYRQDFALPAIAGMQVYPLAAKAGTRFTGEFEVIAPTAESEIQNQEGPGGGSVGRWFRGLLGKKPDEEAAPVPVAWAYAPFNWVSEHELLIRYEPEQLARGQDRSPEGLNLVSAFLVLDVETGLTRVVKAAGEASDPLQSYARLEFLQPLDTFSTWKDLEQNPPPTVGDALPVAAMARHPWTQRLAFLFAQRKGKGSDLASSGQLGLALQNSRLTAALAQDAAWSQELRWSPLGTRLAIASLQAPKRGDRPACTGVSVLDLGLRPSP